MTLAFPNNRVHLPRARHVPGPGRQPAFNSPALKLCLRERMSLSQFRLHSGWHQPHPSTCSARGRKQTRERSAGGGTRGANGLVAFGRARARLLPSRVVCTSWSCAAGNFVERIHILSEYVLSCEHRECGVHVKELLTMNLHFAALTVPRAASTMRFIAKLRSSFTGEAS